MRLRWILVLVSVVASSVVWGCGGGGSEPSDPSGEPMAETEKAGDEVSALANAVELSTDVVEEPALVQVLVSGLSVFRIDSKTAGDGVFFPELSDHRLILSTGVGAYNVPEWNVEKGKETSELAGYRIELIGTATGLDKRTILSNDPATGKPGTAEEATDYRWLLNAGLLGGSVTEFNQGKNNGAWLILDKFTLETCALVLDQKLETSCMVRPIKTMNRFQKLAASEMMVLRLEVMTNEAKKKLIRLVAPDDSTEEIKVMRRDLGDCQTAQSKCVRWSKDGSQQAEREYRWVYDVDLRNVPEPKPGPTRRTMRSEHGKHLKNLFPRRKFNDWEIFTPGCDGTDPSRCNEMCGGPQPPCWEHFKSFPAPSIVWNGKDPGLLEPLGPLDVAICPMVQYP